VLVIDETFSSRPRHPVVSADNIQDRHTGSAGKSPIARSVCSHRMSSAMVMPSSSGRSICRRSGRDRERMASAHVPDNVGFLTKPALALAMVERAIASDVPFSWVAADSVYGVGDIEMALKRAAKGYVLGVNANHLFRSWGKPLAIARTAKDIAEALPDDAWRRLPAGDGTKSARPHDWVYLELADLDADDFDAAFPGIWTPGLLSAARSPTAISLSPLGHRRQFRNRQE
jgi:DDE superfamily endonuclease